MLFIKNIKNIIRCSVGRKLWQDLAKYFFFQIPAWPHLAQLYVLLEPLLETLGVLLGQVVLGVQVMGGG